MKYKHKKTGCEVSPSNDGIYYRTPQGPVLLPKNMVEDTSDWEVVEEPAAYVRLGDTKAIRLSDNMEFSLRDVVRTFAGAYDEEEIMHPILSFEWIKVGNRSVLTAQVGIYKVDLDRLEKAILTTADGVHVFDPSQIVYSISTIWIASHMQARAVQWFLPENMKRIFSTKEARLEYMAMNKPVLTLAEIEEPSAIMHSKWIDMKIKAKEKLKRNDSNL